jgi:hypothetical protein
VQGFSHECQLNFVKEAIQIGSGLKVAVIKQKTSLEVLVEPSPLGDLIQSINDSTGLDGDKHRLGATLSLKVGRCHEQYNPC